MAEAQILINRARLLLSVQRALLGTIGGSVQAICVNWNEKGVVMTAFSAGELPNDEREALEIAATEVAADFPVAVAVDVEVVEHAAEPFRADGEWVFVRLGCSVS
jgi:hypothetical protein